MLKILNINKFIKENAVLEVTNFASFSRNDVTPDGLYSAKIFGITQKEVATTFGYINLKANVMHPSILSSIGKLSTIFKKVIFDADEKDKNKKYAIVSGEIVESESGSSGVGWLFENWNKINLSKYETEKNKSIVSFLSKCKREELFIDKYLVIPPKFRMWTEKHGMRIEDELTGLYKKLIGKASSGHSTNEFMQGMLRTSSRETVIQKAVIEIYDYFLALLEKKEGQFRGSLISKRIDNNVRLVANARPDIPFNCAGLPWHVLLNIFDAFIVGSLNKSIFTEDFGKQLGVDSFSAVKMGEHFDHIFRNVDTYTTANPGKREIWVQLLKEMFEYHSDLRVLLKRDPAWDKNSYHTLVPVIIPTNSYHIVVNSLLYKPLGGDSFNTNFTLIKKNKVITNDELGTISTDNKFSYQLRSLDAIFDHIKKSNNASTF